MDENTKSGMLDLDYQTYLSNKNSGLAGVEIGQYTIEQQLRVQNMKAQTNKNIYRAFNKQGEWFIIKLIDLQQINNEKNQKIQKILKRFAKDESQLMQQCNSPNVLKCYKTFQNISLKAMVLQYCQGETLQTYLSKKKTIPQKQAVIILKQIMNGLAQMHRHHIIHRDLRLQNIIEHHGQYKICDMGLSKKLIIQNQTMEINGTMIGTRTTIAPEIYSNKKYGLKADIWSIGVIFFQMIFGVEPYDSINANQRYAEIERKQFHVRDKVICINDVQASVEARDFFSKVFQVDSEKRIDWKELIKHPLIWKEEVVDLQMKTYNLQSSNNTFSVQQFQQSELLPKSQNTQECQLKDISITPPKLQNPQTIKNQQIKYQKQRQLQYLKAQMIYNQILTPLQANSYIDNQSRQVVEMYFLLVVRCFNNIGFVANRLKGNNGHKDEGLQKQSVFYNKIFAKFKQCSDRLSSFQNKKIIIFYDFFSKIFKSNQYYLKQKMTVGIQHTDYLKIDQINYCYNQYIVKLFPQIKCVCKQAIRVKLFLQNYVKLNMVTVQELGDGSYKQFMEQLIGE